MAISAETKSIATTSTDCTIVLSETYTKLYIKNLDSTNIVWINYYTAGAAVAEANDNVPITPGETIVLPKVGSFKAIAEVSAVKIHWWGVT